MNDFYVYVLFRLDGRPFFVGKGHGKRWTSHERRSRRGDDQGNPHKGHIIRAILAAKSDVPKAKVAEGLSEDEAFNVERAFIVTVGREPRGPLVNMTDGGDGCSGRAPSPATRALLRASQLGRKKSPEHIATRSDESKAKMRAAKVGKPSPKRGVKLTEAQRAKLRGPRGPQPNMRGPRGHWFVDMNGREYVAFAPRVPTDRRGRIL